MMSLLTAFHVSKELKVVLESFIGNDRSVTLCPTPLWHQEAYGGNEEMRLFSCVVIIQPFWKQVEPVDLTQEFLWDDLDGHKQSL